MNENPRCSRRKFINFSLEFSLSAASIYSFSTLSSCTTKEKQEDKSLKI
jgi:hypothetical protein